MGRQHGIGGVHHILGGGAPMQPGQPFGGMALQPLLQRCNHPHAQRPGLARLCSQRLWMQRNRRAGLSNGLCRRLRNQTTFGLRHGKLRFKTQHGIYPLPVAEQLHLRQRMQIGTH